MMCFQPNSNAFVSPVSSAVYSAILFVPLSGNFCDIFVILILSSIKTLTPHHLGDMSHQIPHNILSFADQTLNRTDTFVFSYSPYQE